MSIVRIFNEHDHHGYTCRKCHEPFKIGDKLVSVRVTHGWDHGSKRGTPSSQHHRTRRYHTRCYVDAHGDPIYE